MNFSKQLQQLIQNGYDVFTNTMREGVHQGDTGEEGAAGVGFVLVYGKRGMVAVIKRGDIFMGFRNMRAMGVGLLGLVFMNVVDHFNKLMKLIG